VAPQREHSYHPVVGWRHLTLLVCGLVLLSNGVPTAAAEITPEEMHRLLNTQREYHGFPSVKFSAPHSDGCSKHNNYMALNGVFGHGEEPGRPGYTPEGANHGLEVLAWGFYTQVWSERANPWTNFPLHNQMLFDPLIDIAGGHTSHGFACYRAALPTRAITEPTFYSMPGNGTDGIPTTTNATGERPFAPQELVGLGGRDTGFQPLVYLQGHGGYRATVESATMTGLDGPVDLRWVDANTPGAGLFYESSATLIPVEPLRGLATYNVAMRWAVSNGRRIDSAFSFQTAEIPKWQPFLPSPPSLSSMPSVPSMPIGNNQTFGQANRVSLRVSDLGKNDWSFQVESQASNASLRLTSPRRVARHVPFHQGKAEARDLRPGPWRACATSGGGNTGYAITSNCRAFRSVGVADVTLPTRLLRRRLTLTVGAATIGQAATVSFIASAAPCRARQRCGQFAGGLLGMRRVRLSGSKVKLRVPSTRIGTRVTVVVRVPRFHYSGARYRGAKEKRTYR
jgi:hypothetical protein